MRENLIQYTKELLFENGLFIQKINVKYSIQTVFELNHIKLVVSKYEKK